MASRLIQDLTPEMYKKALAVIEMCGLKGVELLIYCTLRTLHEQARLYRQSRSTGVIDYKAAKLRARGFGYLADILMGVGPCRGPHVTDAGPGESWHAYGEAFDGVPMVNGKPAWSYEGSPREWNIYGQCAEEAGLNWAGRWPDFRENPHVQLREGGNPLKVMTPREVGDTLTRKLKNIYSEGGL